MRNVSGRNCRANQTYILFRFNKTNRCSNFPNLFWLKNEFLRVSGSSSAHHQEFFNCTFGTGTVHIIRFEDSLRAVPEWFHPGPARKLSSDCMTYTIAKCTVNELLMMGRGTARNM
jgi:hypothetical protein